MASSAPLDPAIWTPDNVQDNFNARYVAATGLTLMIWTHLTTLDQEMKHIWRNGNGLTLNKCLFAAVRYFTTFAFFFHCLTLFLARPSFNVCRGIIVFAGAAALGLIGACDLILLLRTWAIYNRSRKSFIWLGLLLGVTHIPTLVLGALWMTTLRIAPSPLYPVIPGCSLETTAVEDFWHVLIPSIVYNTVLSGASMYKIWSYHRTRFNTPLISLLVRDRMVYYVIILTAYMCDGFFMFHQRLIVVTIEGRFITWVVAVTCAQLQLNLRSAVYHVPEYVTTYYTQQNATELINNLPSRVHRPGIETLIIGGTATELERDNKYINSTDTEGEPEERRYHHTIELVTTSVNVPRGATGKKKKMSAPSADFTGGGKRPPLLPQLRRANSFQGSPSHPPWHSVDMTAGRHAATDDALPLSPTSNAHSEPSSRTITRAVTPLSRTNRVALGFDTKHNWALARPSGSSSPATPSSKSKKQNSDSSQVGIPLEDMDPVLPQDPIRSESPKTATDPSLQVEVQVEREHDNSGMSPLPRLSEYEESTRPRSASQDGGIRATRVGVWR